MAAPRRHGSAGPALDAPAPEPGAGAGQAAELGAPGDPETVARIICLRMLDRRAYSRTELAAALHRRGVPDDAATAVLDRFGEVGLIDDAALARGIAASQHAERGLAARAVRHKLRQRGIADVDAAAAVEAIDADSERAAAARLVARKLRTMSGLEPATRARRLVGLLARKGYPAGLAYEVVRAAVSELDEQPPLD